MTRMRWLLGDSEPVFLSGMHTLESRGADSIDSVNSGSFLAAV